MTLYETHCPSWCQGNHPDHLSDVPDAVHDDFIIHEYEFPDMPDVTDKAGTGRVDVRITQLELVVNRETCFLDPPALHATIPERDCSPVDLYAIAKALDRCAVQAGVLMAYTDSSDAGITGPENILTLWKTLTSVPLKLAMRTGAQS